MQEDPEDPNEPGHEECMIFSPDGRTRILFIEVPDGKQVKNRIHFDLRPIDGTRDEEVERLADLGAKVVADQRRPDGRLGDHGRPRGQRVLRAARRGRGGRPVRTPGRADSTKLTFRAEARQKVTKISHCHCAGHY